MKVERNATLRELIAEISQPLWRAAANARLDELEAALSAAQSLRDSLKLGCRHAWEGFHGCGGYRTKCIKCGAVITSQDGYTWTIKE